MNQQACSEPHLRSFELLAKPARRTTPQFLAVSAFLKMSATLFPIWKVCLPCTFEDVGLEVRFHSLGSPPKAQLS